MNQRSNTLTACASHADRPPENSTATRVVLLANLGSPDSPSVMDVRRYLREFLMDERVLDTAYPLRWFIVNCMILPRRPRASAEAYKLIWWHEGSPLIVISKRLQAALQKQVNVPVELAMRYGKPSSRSVLNRIVAEYPVVEEIHLIPLYPHYAMSSYETCVEKIKDEMRTICPDIKLTVQAPFYQNPEYIQSLVENAMPFLENPFDHLLFSFHGLPERHMKKADTTGAHCLTVENCCQVDSPAHHTCYRAQVHRTAECFAEQAKIPADKYSVSFQSRLGREQWLTPYTDKTLEELPARGIKNLLVISPAFVSDCLETLEEIALRGKESFLQAGGKSFTMIPCLNEHPKWIKTLANWINGARG